MATEVSTPTGTFNRRSFLLLKNDWVRKATLVPVNTRLAPSELCAAQRRDQEAAQSLFVAVGDAMMVTTGKYFR
jgi:hypothetical protein